MKKTIFIFAMCCFVLSSVTFAQGRWEMATNIGKEPTGDVMLTKCIYKTIGGYQFSIVVRGLCPFTVQVNAETGEVKK